MPRDTLLPLAFGGTLECTSATAVVLASGFRSHRAEDLGVPAPLPRHSSPLPADIPPWCRGDGRCALHGAGHRGAQHAGLLSRCSHRLSPLRGSREPPHVRDWWVSVGHSLLCLWLSSSRWIPHQLRCAFMVAQVPTRGTMSMTPGGGTGPVAPS